MTINCKGNLIDLSTPKVMGIINVTPDSFYDGGKNYTLDDAIIQARTHIEAGATFLDIGGYSSRPGASEVSQTEEIARTIPIIEAISAVFPSIPISIDTFRSEVAKEAIVKGAAFVNDISGGQADEAMFKMVAEAGVPYILMHMRGTPQTMTQFTQYIDVTRDVLYYFSEQLAKARAAGISDIIADPGFGFSKTREQSFELLKNLEFFKTLGIPFLVGLSRKSLIYKTLETQASEALNGTSALNSIALYKGASILRVHDVKEAVECVKLYEMLSGVAKNI